MSAFADPLDQALDLQEQLVNFEISNIRNKGRELHPIGECHWCCKPFEKASPKLFCDSECGAAHHKYG